MNQRFQESNSALSIDLVSHVFEGSMSHNPESDDILDVRYTTNKGKIKASFGL